MPQLDWLETSVTRLSPGFPDKLAIVDIETTGGSPKYHRVIEVAVLLVDDGVLVDRWQNLIQPGVNIPPKINQLTGICDTDLQAAPAFEQVAEELLGLLDDRVFVAHNARFDQGFIKAEFKRCGLQFKPRVLCSVKLSRHLFPQFTRHSLNHIIRRFSYSVDNRHRAMDDAVVVWRFFQSISQIHEAEEIASACDLIFKAPSLPVLLDAEEVNNLPRSPGVYYFYDANGKLLYIGKSVNIKERVKSHFSQTYLRGRQFRLYSSVARVEYELTPSDFGAQIRESQQIKQLHPDYNLRLKKSRYLYFYTTYPNKEGYLQVGIERIAATLPDTNQHYGLFRSQKQAQTQLSKLADNFFLCLKLIGLEKSSNKKQSCFRTQLKKCFGACCGQEQPEIYNERLKAALKSYQIMQWPWPDAILIRETSTTDRDFSRYHLVNQWRYLGQILTEQDLEENGYRYADNNQAGFEKSDANTNPGQDIDDKFFDLDIYYILVRFLLNSNSQDSQTIKVFPLLSLTG